MLILFHYWSLPILFLLHDFEEMIFMPLWKKRAKFISLKETKIGSFFGKSYRRLRIQHRGAGRVYRTPPSLSVLRAEP